MELGELQNFVLLLLFVGLIIGVGIVVFDQTGRAALNDATTTEGNVRLWAPNYTTLANTYITTNTGVTAINSTNATNTVTPLTLEFDSTGKWAGNGNAVRVRLASGSSGNGSTFNITYTYGVDSAATDALQATRTEVAGIASNWLGLIVTVAILAIVLGLVIRSFGGVGRQ